MATSLEPVLSSPGWELLAALQDKIGELDADPLALAESLRKEGIAPELASAVLAQIALRRSARAKFGDFARHMIFTRDGLEQATRLVVAAHHARRFVDAGVAKVADLGCGIGADSMAIAGLGVGVLAVDIDEDAAAAASANLRAFPEAEVELGNVLDFTMSELRARGIDAVFADPARRTGAKKGGGRLMDPESWSPPLSAVLTWAEEIPAVGVKVAPGIAHDALPAQWRVQWTSVDSDLVEAALWSPALSPEGPGRCALVIRDGAAHALDDPEIDAADSPAPALSVAGLRRFIGEPDDAVIRAGLVRRLGEDLGAALVSDKIAYLSAAEARPSPFISWFEVLDVVALRPKQISARLRELGIGRLEVKKRGADIDPALLRKQLRLDGAGEATLVATRIEGRHRAIIARRIGAEASTPS